MSRWWVFHDDALEDAKDGEDVEDAMGGEGAHVRARVRAHVHARVHARARAHVHARLLCRRHHARGRLRLCHHHDPHGRWRFGYRIP